MKLFAVLFTLICSRFCITFAAKESAHHGVRRTALLQLLGLGPSRWEKFKTKYGREYPNATEEAKRKQIFQDNLQIIEMHNKGNSTFTLGINQFSDMTTQEFDQQMLMKGLTNEAASPNAYTPSNGMFDWSTGMCMSQVKDQGSCASSWAFSATTSTEFYNCEAGGGLVLLSEQNLIDCSSRYGNEGCTSGKMDAAFQYIIDNSGIDTEAKYPYEAKISNCRYNLRDVGAKLTGYTATTSGSEEALEPVVGAIGVVSAMMDASGDDFKNYKAGIYTNPQCNNSQLNQAVVIVGYGSQVVEGGQLVYYWLIKNSWGTSWGEGGYFRMVRGVNMCGIANQASYPKI